MAPGLVEQQRPMSSHAQSASTSSAKHSSPNAATTFGRWAGSTPLVWSMPVLLTLVLCHSYSCINTHLQAKKECPVCTQSLQRSDIYPNTWRTCALCCFAPLQLAIRLTQHPPLLLLRTHPSRPRHSEQRSGTSAPLQVSCAPARPRQLQPAHRPCSHAPIAPPSSTPSFPHRQ